MKITVMPVGHRDVGVAGPVHISDQLADFLKVDRQAKLPRTHVVMHIARYIKANNLEDPANRRYIIPDARLSSLLWDFNSGDTLSFFNLQRYLRKNFMNTKPILTNNVLTFGALPVQAFRNILNHIGFHEALRLASVSTACALHVRQLKESLMIELIMKYAKYADKLAGDYHVEKDDLIDMLRALRALPQNERPIWSSAMQAELEDKDWLTEYLDNVSDSQTINLCPRPGSNTSTVHNQQANNLLVN